MWPGFSTLCPAAQQSTLSAAQRARSTAAIVRYLRRHS
jgi:hypothetical protein